MIMLQIGLKQKNILKGIDNMKKIIALIFTFIVLITTCDVHAANYNLKELIPVGTTTTIIMNLKKEYILRV